MSSLLVEAPALGNPVQVTRYTEIEMPKAGELSEEGRYEILQVLGKYHEFVPWFTKHYLNKGLITWDIMVEGKGRYVGSLAKRIGKAFHDAYHYSMPQEVMGQIGTIIANHADRTREVRFDIVDRFDWNAGEFGDSGSCYWTGSNKFRHYLKKSKSLACRRYGHKTDPYGNKPGIARCWLTPYYGMHVVYNAYGVVSLAGFARMLSHWCGLTYIQVNLVRPYEEVAFVNGEGHAYLLGPQEILSKFDYGPKMDHTEPHKVFLPIPRDRKLGEVEEA